MYWNISKQCECVTDLQHNPPQPGEQTYLSQVNKPTWARWTFLVKKMIRSANTSSLEWLSEACESCSRMWSKAGRNASRTDPSSLLDATSVATNSKYSITMSMSENTNTDKKHCNSHFKSLRAASANNLIMLYCSKYDAFRSWRPNGICANLVHHPPATLSARSATGCVAHGLGFLPTTSHTRDDETHRIDGSVHECCTVNKLA